MWNVTPSNRYDWDDMKDQIMQHGLRNSLLFNILSKYLTDYCKQHYCHVEFSAQILFDKKTLSEN